MENYAKERHRRAQKYLFVCVGKRVISVRQSSQLFEIKSTINFYQRSGPKMQRKSTSKSRGPNADEKSFHAWLKNRPCCIDGTWGAEVHHMYGSTFKNNKVLIGHWACIPLSENLHRGPAGFHTNKSEWLQWNGPQSRLWLSEYTEYVEETDNECPSEVFASIMAWGR